MTTAEVVARRKAGYDPRKEVDRDPELAMLLDSIAHGRYAADQPTLFAPFVKDLIERDPFMVLADFRAYIDCQRRVSRAWTDVTWWTRASIHNAARCGRFSSDRSIREYAERIWKISPVPVTL
jgi:starch phosphorylase